MDAAARALSDPTRREILTLVRDEERSASDIAANFDVTRPAISQHLKVLHSAELVSVRQDGTRRLYSARPEGMGELRAWMDDFWSSRLTTLKVEVEREMWNEAKDERAARSRRKKGLT